MLSDQLKRIVRRAGALILLVLAFVSTHKVYWKTALAHRQLPIMTWGYFHYELNARYFRELGYTNLYACAIAADGELGHRYYAGHVARDLETYEAVSITEYKPCPRERFTPERWSSFVQDVGELSRATTMYEGIFADDADRYWNYIIYDKGYNAPPPLVVLTQWSLALTEWAGSHQRVLASMVDVIALLAAFWVSYRTFGAGATWWLAISLFAFWGTTGVVLGHLWQYVWLASLVFLFAAVKRESWRQAGFWLAFAITTRVFPVFFAVPFAWRWLVAKREKQLQEERSMRVVLISCALFSLGFLGIGMFSGLGLEGWRLFAQKMHTHSTYIVGELFDIGWKNFVATFITNDLRDFVRLYVFEAWKMVAFGAAGVMTVALVWWNRRAPLERWLLLSIPLMFLWIVLSPYYYHVLALVPLVIMGWQPERSWRSWPMGDMLLVGLFIATLTLHFQFGWTGVEYTNYSLVEHRVSEMLIAVYMLCIAYFAGVPTRTLSRSSQ